jgi:hypothetical protein
MIVELGNLAHLIEICLNFDAISAPALQIAETFFAKIAYFQVILSSYLGCRLTWKFLPLSVQPLAILNAGVWQLVMTGVSLVENDKNEI